MAISVVSVPAGGEGGALVVSAGHSAVEGNRLKIHLIGISAAVLASGAALGGCSAAPKPPPPQPPAVSVVTIETQPVTLESDLPGRTNPLQVSDVRPQVNGIIQARLFVEGANVRAGQLLYQIDPAPYRATLDQELGLLASARAALVTARLKSERYADMVKINAVSHQDADDARATADSDAATVKQDAAAVESARINLGYTRVTAPISGRIGLSSITKGALVTNGQTTALTTVQKLDPIYVDVAQTDVELLALRADMARAAVTGETGPPLAVKLKLGDGQLYPIAGKLQFTDVTVDQNTGSVTLRAIFPNPRALLLPGMYVRALVSEGVDPHGILVPQAAVTHDEKGRATALVVDGQGRAQSRILVLAGVIGNQWRVIDGLKPGDRLIVAGGANAKPGEPVRIVASHAQHAVPAS
jgi:membrane fusion protein (multidrug efflux system)